MKDAGFFLGELDGERISETMRTYFFPLLFSNFMRFLILFIQRQDSNREQFYCQIRQKIYP